MKFFLLPFVAFLLSCSTGETKKVASTPNPRREIAQIELTEKDLSSKRVKELVTHIFHSYILGQVLLNEFDVMLDKNAEGALSSDAYQQLLSVRVLVDQFEEDINELYLKLVMVSALPKYGQDQKAKANEALKIIGDFLAGLTTDKKQLPDNIKPLILSNLQEKQTALYEELKSIHDSLDNKDAASKKIIHQNMVLLRATRRHFYREYKVDQAVLEVTVREEENKESYRKFKKNIKKMSKEMKKFNKTISQGRATSSDTIFPSASASGNITGRGFPQNTWSLTYDDGPGGKTTPTILKNLTDRKLKATFFMLAKQVEALPTVAKNIQAAGMDIASHSYDHAQLTKVSGTALTKQIEGSKKVIETKLGVPVKLFRLPYGAGVGVPSIRTKIAAAGMIHIFWNVDTLDWQDKNPQSIFERTKKQMKAFPNNAGVVLFHDIHPQSVIASTLLMDHFIANKVNLCTVQEVIDQINQGLPSCTPVTTP